MAKTKIDKIKKKQKKTSDNGHNNVANDEQMLENGNIDDTVNGNDINASNENENDINDGEDSNDNARKLPKLRK